MTKIVVSKRLLGGFFLFLSIFASFITLIAAACAADFTVPLFFCIFICCLLSGIGLLRLRKWGTYFAIVTSGLILFTASFLIYRSMFHVSVGAPKFSPDGKNLVMSVRTVHGGGVYKINLSDNSFQRLTFPPPKANDMNPAYSPDGSKVVFSRFQEGGERTRLFLMDADGANLIKLTRGFFDINPRFSRDGKKVYFIRTDKGLDTKGYGYSLEALYSIALDGLIIQKLTSPGEYDFGRGVSLSPDGSSLLINANKKGESVNGWMSPMRIIDLNNASETLIEPNIKQFHPDKTIPANSGIRGADFSMDGDIVFSGFLKLQDLKGNYLNDSYHSIYEFNLGTKQVKKVIDTDSHFGEGPNVSPNGHKITFCTGSSYSCDKIFIANRDGSELKEIKVKLK